MRVLAALVALTAGCRLLRPIDPTPDEQPVEPPVEAQQARKSASVAPGSIVSAPLPERVGKLGDGNIAAMLLASNNTDISYARLVPARAMTSRSR